MPVNVNTRCSLTAQLHRSQNNQLSRNDIGVWAGQQMCLASPQLRRARGMAAALHCTVHS